MDELINTSDNIIVTSACLGGILHGTNEDLRDRFIGFLKNNKNRCFLEIQHHPFAEQCDYNVELAFLSKTIGVPLIAGTDTHSIDEEHAASRAILQKAKKVHFESEDQCDLVLNHMTSYVKLMKSRVLYLQMFILKPLRTPMFSPI